MQKLIVVISSLFLIVIATSVDARNRGGQGGKGHGGYGGVDRQAQFQQKLDLSDEQISQMQEIRLNGGTREEMHSVLSEEQRALVNEHRGQMKGLGGRGSRDGNGNGRRGRGNGQGFGNSQAEAEGANGG
jgi:Spy/CpxP family protein refolding chaperone